MWVPSLVLASALPSVQTASFLLITDLSVVHLLLLGLIFPCFFLLSTIARSQDSESVKAPSTSPPHLWKQWIPPHFLTFIKSSRLKRFRQSLPFHPRYPPLLMRPRPKPRWNDPRFFICHLVLSRTDLKLPGFLYLPSMSVLGPRRLRHRHRQLLNQH